MILEKWDIRATMFGDIPVSEVDAFEKYWEAFPGLRDALFKEVSAGYLQPRTKDIKGTIDSFESVEAYRVTFTKAFVGFYETLKEDLIDGILDVSAEQEKEKITEDIFGRIDRVKLADRYVAYQVFAEILGYYLCGYRDASDRRVPGHYSGRSEYGNQEKQQE